MSNAFQLVVVLLAVGMYLALPVVTISGWIRWAGRSHHYSTPSSILSVIGFTFATLSGVLAISSVMYAHAIGGFAFYDPLLLRIYRAGGLLSLTGIIFSLSGVWRPSVLRWHAPICSVGTLLFWFISAMGE